MIDNANPAFAPVDDFLGNVRPSKADIGAFELRPLSGEGPPNGKFSVAPVLLLLGN